MTSNPRPPSPQLPDPDAPTASPPGKRGRVLFQFLTILLSALAIIGSLPLGLFSVLFLDNFGFGTGFAHLVIFALSVSLPFLAVISGVLGFVLPGRLTLGLGAIVIGLSIADWCLWLSPLASGLIH